MERDFVNEIVETMASSMEGCCYLEHQSRAIEVMFDTMRGEHYEEFKKHLETLPVNEKNEQRVKLIELKELSSQKFHISKFPKSPKDNKYFGYASYYENGYQIAYAHSDKTEPVCERIIIAHELGHLRLHYFADPSLVTNLPSNTRGFKDEKMENEADFFALCIIRNRSNFYSDSDGKMKSLYVFTPEEINQKFLRVKNGIPY